MAITCATIKAAAQVLTVLIRANLRPGLDFHLTPLDAAMPIRITVLVDLPADILRQLCAVPNITIT